jgi:hypothetical protein
MENTPSESAFPAMPQESAAVHPDTSPEELTENSAANRSAKSTKRLGLGVLLAGVLSIFGPIIVPLIMVPLSCGPDANEGNCSWAVLPWLLIVSVPFGLVLLIIGGIILAVAGRKKSKARA